jgi:hypothetical protein
MSIAIALLTLAGLVVVLVLLSRLSADLQALRVDLKLLKRESRVVIPAAWTNGHPHHHHVSMGRGYFALWRWEAGKWKLVMGILPPGVDSGPPPRDPGQCTGETRKVWVTASQR